MYIEGGDYQTRRGTAIFTARDPVESSIEAFREIVADPGLSQRQAIETACSIGRVTGYILDKIKLYKDQDPRYKPWSLHQAKYLSSASHTARYILDEKQPFQGSMVFTTRVVETERLVVIRHSKFLVEKQAANILYGGIVYLPASDSIKLQGTASTRSDTFEAFTSRVFAPDPAGQMLTELSSLVTPEDSIPENEDRKVSMQALMYLDTGIKLLMEARKCLPPARSQISLDTPGRYSK